MMKVFTVLSYYVDPIFPSAQFSTLAVYIEIKRINGLYEFLFI